MDQIIAYLLETGVTSPVIIIILGIACVYLYKKYESFTELTRKTQQQNLDAINDIKHTLNDTFKTNEDIDATLKNLQERVRCLESKLNTIDGKSTSEMTAIIRDIDTIKRFIEMCCVLNNKGNRGLIINDL